MNESVTICKQASKQASKHQIAFSVILPAYNRENSVNRAIESIISQDYRNWELIIVDDGSTDNTYEVCKAYLCDNRISLFYQDNKGVSGARNTGLDHAVGEYIIFLDSDDYYKSTALSSLCEAITKSDYPDMVCFGFCGADGKGEWIPQITESNYVYDETIRCSILPEHVNVLPQSKCFLQPYIWNKCIKNTLLKTNNIRFDEFRKTWEDNPLFVRCLTVSKNLYILQEALYVLCGDEKSEHLSSVYNENLLTGYLRSYSEYVERFGKEYNFDNDYTNRRYFTYTCSILTELSKKYKTEEYNRILSETISNPDVQFWASRVKPKCFLERITKNAIQTRNMKLLREILIPDSKFNTILGKVKTFLGLPGRAYNKIKKIILSKQ